MMKSGRKVLWRAIAEDLEAQIRDGRLGAGQRLPTENDFAAEYAVNRHTVRRALADLQERGLVEVTQGRGSFVRRAMRTVRLGREWRLEDIFELQRASSEGDVPDAAPCAAPRDVAQALGLGDGDEVVIVERRGYADGEPVAASTHFIPARTAKPAFFHALGAGDSVDEALRAAGCDAVAARATRVTARPASSREQIELALPRHAAVMIAESVVVNADEQPVEFVRARLPSDRVELFFDSAAAVDAPEGAIRAVPA